MAVESFTWDGVEGLNDVMTDKNHYIFEIQNNCLFLGMDE